MRILCGLATLMVAYVSGGVCLKLYGIVRENIRNGDPTMLLGRFRLEASYGHLVPGLIGLIALGCLAISVYLLLWKRDDRG